MKVDGLSIKGTKIIYLGLNLYWFPCKVFDNYDDLEEANRDGSDDEEHPDDAHPQCRGDDNVWSAMKCAVHQELT